MSTDQPSRTFGQKLGRFFGFLLRLFFVLLVAIGLGFGIYYAAGRAIPELYKRYIQPVEDNTLRLDDLEIRQAQELTLLNERISTLQSRLTDLEIQRDKDRQIITALETQTLLSQNAQSTQSAVIEEQQTNLNEMQSALDLLSQEIAATNLKVDTLNSEAQNTNQELATLQAEIQILQTMDYVTRARLFLSQDNLAQSEMNILASLESLERLQEQVSDEQSASLEQISVYLETALNVLPKAPLTAADQLERAWQLLIQESPQIPIPSAPTPSG